MARTSRRQPNSYRGGRVVGNLAYDERYAERRAPRRESEQREQPREEFIRPPRRQEKKAVRPRVRERQRVSGVLVLGFAALSGFLFGGVGTVFPPHTARGIMAKQGVRKLLTPYV